MKTRTSEATVANAAQIHPYVGITIKFAITLNKAQIPFIQTSCACFPIAINVKLKITFRAINTNENKTICKATSDPEASPLNPETNSGFAIK